VAGRLYISGVIPLPVAVAVGVVLVLPVGLALGAICSRTVGLNLAIVTLGFAVAVEYLIFDSSTLTGPAGIVIGGLSLFGWNITATEYPGRYAAVAVVALFLAGIATANIRRGVVGRRLLSVRANERAAASLGIRPTEAKVYAIGLGAMIAALGGIVLAFANTTIVFGSFDTLASLQSIPGAVIGGLGWVGGSAIGGFGQVGGVLQQGLGYLFGATVASYVPLGMAVLLVVVLRAQPDGGAIIMARQLRPLARLLGVRPDIPAREPAVASKRSGMPKATPAPAGPGYTRAPTVGYLGPLTVTELTVRFGGVTAVENLSLFVRPGEVVGLIGPNGAGKTTVIDAIGGYVKPAAGSIQLGDCVLNGLPPSERVRRGMTRTFQSLELFEDLTVIDNLRIAGDRGGRMSYATDILWPRVPVLSDGALRAIPEFGLADKLALLPSELPYSSRRLVAIARAVATGPSVLLLDEPAAGLDSRERNQLVEVIRGLVQERGIGVLLVEHDVGMVMRVCDRIYVMELGRVISHGAPADVRNDERVISAYLGSTVRAAAAETDAVRRTS
jgi:sulfate-transporting ATPase